VAPSTNRRVVARSRRVLASGRRVLARPIAVGLAALLSGALLWGVVGVASASAEEIATLHASFSPDRLGVSTTIGFTFEVRTSEGLAPPPLTGLDLHLPKGMNYINTTLGLAICSPKTLERKGEAGCPTNAKLGDGTAAVEVPFGTGAGKELPQISAWMGPPTNGNMVVLFYVDGKRPVYGQFIFEGEVLPETGIFGSQLEATVPLVTSVPGGPDVSIVRANANIGPEGLTYFRKVHGHRERFKPRGISVPEHCPAGGFPISASFSFQDGSTAEASTTVPCPRG
jgi:hypothetical protein